MKRLQKQILAAMLTGAITVNLCPAAVSAADVIETEIAVTQEFAEETTETVPSETTVSAEFSTETAAEETALADESATETTTEEALAEDTDTELILEAASDDPVTEFVSRMYQICLEREPDPNGLKNWHDQISSGKISAVQASLGFLNSKEYRARQLSDADYIANLYQLYLNRTGSNAEIQHWLTVYQSGVSKSYLIHGFSNSKEFTNLCNSYGVMRGSTSLTENRDKYPGIAKMVVNAYAVLGRMPNGNEINSWISKTKNGGSGAALVKNILQSKEYQNKKSSDEAYIADLYQAFFGRSCSAAEVTKWKNTLNQGVSRTYLMAQFSASAEFKRTCSANGISNGKITLNDERDKHPGIAKMISGYYQVLGRTPSGSEMESWVKKAMAGSGAEIADGFFKSKEYSNKKTSNEQYITDLYTAVLERKPSSSDISAWVKELNGGKSRDQVRSALCDSSEFKQLCKQLGIKDRSVRYPQAAAVLNQVGWNLKAAFQWSAGMKYSKYTATAAPGTEYYASYGFANRKGNCYVMAATFCEMARELGYDAKQISGSVPLRAGGMGPHSWVEIKINGTVYVFDPDFTNETKRNGYQITYGQSGTWRYNRGSVMN